MDPPLKRYRPDASRQTVFHFVEKAERPAIEVRHRGPSRKKLPRRSRIFRQRGAPLDDRGGWSCPLADPAQEAARPALRRLAAPLFEHPKSAPTLHVTLTATGEVFRSILQGELNPTMAFMTGKLSVDGNMGLAMQLGAALG